MSEWLNECMKIIKSFYLICHHSFIQSFIHAFVDEDYDREHD